MALGFFNRIGRIFQRQAPPPTTDDAPPPPRPTAISRLLSVESDRRSVVLICRQMYDIDPRAKESLRTLARDATSGGFQIVVHRGPQAARAREVAQQLMDRLNLPTRCDNWSRLTFRDGDSFLELGVDAAGLIQQVTRKPTLEMHRESDEFDEFADPSHAYWWADEGFGTMGQAPASARWFAEWQIVHARWDHDEGSRYGSPMYAAARKAWKRLDEGETDMAVRRKTRAGQVRVHVLEGASDPQIQEYQERNAGLLGAEGLKAAISDFFTNVKGGISTLEGDANLGEISDVQHHLTTWGIGSPLPLFLLGYGENLNRDVLEEQSAQYDQALIGIQQWIDDQIIYPMIERQWLLQGILPEGLKYEIVRPPRKPLSPELLQAVAATVTSLREAGMPEVMIWELAARLLPGLDLTRLQKLLAEQAAQAADAAKAAGLPPGGTTTAPDEDEGEKDAHDPTPDPGQSDRQPAPRAERELQGDGAE